MSDQVNKPKTAVKLSDNDVLMLLQTAELNAGSKSPSLYHKQLYSALRELYESRTKKDNPQWDVPSGWRGKDPWFNVGDLVKPIHIGGCPLDCTIIEITDRGFKYVHERWSFGPRQGWTEGGETFEPSGYELVETKK